MYQPSPTRVSTSGEKRGHGIELPKARRTREERETEKEGKRECQSKVGDHRQACQGDWKAGRDMFI